MLKKSNKRPPITVAIGGFFGNVSRGVDTNRAAVDCPALATGKAMQSSGLLASGDFRQIACLPPRSDYYGTTPDCRLASRNLRR